MTFSRSWPASTSKSPLLIAHRGLPWLHPENSASGFAAARRCGAVAVELDIRSTRDGRLVVLHDESLERVTGERGLVADMASSKILDQRFLTDGSEGPISLDLALELLTKGGNAPWVDIEIKDGPSADPEVLVSLVASAWKRSGSPERVLVTSTAASILEAARSRLPDLQRGMVFRFEDERDPVTTALELGASLVVADRRRVGEPWATKAQRHRLSVWVYTVNDPEEAMRWAARGCGIMTDDLPGLGKAW